MVAAVQLRSLSRKAYVHVSQIGIFRFPVFQLYEGGWVRRLAYRAYKLQHWNFSRWNSRVWHPRIIQISRDGLSYPSTIWMRTCCKLEDYFVNTTNSGLKKTETLTSIYNGALPLSSQNPEIPFEAITLFLRTRMYIRLKGLNQQVREESQQKKAKRKVKEFIN